MPSSLESILPHVPAFVLVLFRLSGIFLFAPLFGSNLIPMRVKVLLALVLSFCVYPLIPPQIPLELSLMTIAGAITSELLIGLLIGYGASLPLIALQLAGMLMGQQLGLGLARIFNPDLDDETEVLGQFFYLVALTIFLLLDGHHILLATLIRSFDHVPLGGYMADLAVLQVLTGLLTSMLELGIRVAAPLLTLVFLETVAMGFVARTVPQLNILSLGFPLRIILGFFMCIGLVAVMHDEFAASLRHALTAMMRVFG